MHFVHGFSRICRALCTYKHIFDTLYCIRALSRIMSTIERRPIWWHSVGQEVSSPLSAKDIVVFLAETLTVNISCELAWNCTDSHKRELKSMLLTVPYLNFHYFLAREWDLQRESERNIGYVVFVLPIVRDGITLGLCSDAIVTINAPVV